MGKTIADGYLELRADATRLPGDIRKATAAISLQKQGRAIGRGLGDAIGKGVESSGVLARTAATMAARLTIMGSAAAAATPGVLQLTAALAPAAGAAAALPVALASIKVAAATFKIATAGVGDAITKGLTGTAEQAKKALQELPPAARTFAASIIALKPQIAALKASVSERFFLPLQNDIVPLARLYLPMLRTEMADLAGPLGGLGEQFAESARKAAVFGAVRGLFQQTGQAAVNLRAGIDPLVTDFAKLITATVPYLPKIADGLASAATATGRWLGSFAESGRVTEVIDNAVDTFRDLGGIARNVGSILSSVFSSAGAGAGSLLGNIKSLTGQLAAFLRSGEGSSGLTSLFSGLSALGEAMRTSLAAVLPAVTQSIRALAPAVTGLAPALAQVVVAVAPLLPYFVSLAATILIKLTPAISALAGWLTRNQDALKVVVITVGAYIAVQKAAAVAAGAHAAVLAVQAAGGLLAFLKSTTLVTAATKVWTAGQWLLNAALTANPIGIVVVALGALVAALVVAYRNSDTFRKIVQDAWKGIQSTVSYAWTNVIRPTASALVDFFRNVVAPTATWLHNNIFRPSFTAIGTVVKTTWSVIQTALTAFRTFLTTVVGPTVRWLHDVIFRPVFSAIGAAVQAAWVVIQTALGAFRLYLLNVVGPVVRWLYDSVIRPVFSGIGSFISSTWNNVIRPIFSALGGFLQSNVAPAFRKGVDAIRAAWDGVKAAARVPVSFVVNSVLNPLIKGINSAAGFVGVKDRIPVIGGFASGGRIAGPPSNRDNRLAAGPAGMLAVASGEFITNTASTQANLPLIKAINAKRGKVTRDDVDPYLDGFAAGGRVGDRMGDGIGDFFGGLIRGAKGIGNAILNPKKALTDVAGAALNRIPGSGGLVDMVRGMGSRLIRGVGSWLAEKIAGSGIGGAGIAGGWRGMQAAISARFPGLGLISGFRPSSRTLSGNLSYHAQGRAVDYPPSRPLAAWIKSTYGSKTKELITPFQDLNLHHGKPHTYTGAVWNQHNFAGGNAHVHWAAARGGLVGRSSGMPAFPTFDRGGRWPSGTFAANTSGHTEHVMTGGPGGDMDRMLDVLESMLGVLRGMGGDVADAINSSTRRAAVRARTAAPAGAF